MHIINVGAHKNGSTWIHNVLEAVVSDRSFPPDLDEMSGEWRAIDQVRVDERHRKLLAAINEPNNWDRDAIYLFKIHFHQTRWPPFIQLVFRDDTYFVNVKRDPRDVLVSFYYHEIAGRKIRTFPEFMKTRSQGLLAQYVAYHSYWDTLFRLGKTNIVTLRYDSLKTSYESEILRMFNLLDIPRERLHIALNLYDLAENRKKKKSWMQAFDDAGLNFYRKGESGDYLNHFDDHAYEIFSNEYSRLRGEDVYEIASS
jgi:hypothetical protein